MLCGQCGQNIWAGEGEPVICPRQKDRLTRRCYEELRHLALRAGGYHPESEISIFEAIEHMSARYPRG